MLAKNNSQVQILPMKTAKKRSSDKKITLVDVADAFELRAMAESLAARRAAERISPEVLEKMRECNARIDRATVPANPDVDAFLEGNRQFHALIVEAAGSPRLGSVLATLVEQPVVWRTAQTYGRNELRRSHREHCELLAAFERRDGAWAEAIMSAHIRRAYHAYADAHGNAVGDGCEREAG